MGTGQCTANAGSKVAKYAGFLKCQTAHKTQRQCRNDRIPSSRHVKNLPGNRWRKEVRIFPYHCNAFLTQGRSQAVETQIFCQFLSGG